MTVTSAEPRETSPGLSTARYTIDLDIGFSTVPLRRNLLGRDFFNLVQIGFRERQQVFYVRGEP